MINVNTVTAPTWKASVTMGRNIGYSNELISIDEITETIAIVQQEIANQLKVKLSAKLTPCIIVFAGQKEDSVTLDFIQYPKFLYEESKLKEAVLQFTKKLMVSFNQNRIVVVFLDETIMLEQSDTIDPRIKWK